MTEIYNNLYNFIVSKKHHQYRHTVDWNLAEEYSAKGLSPIDRMTDRFKRVCEEEKPVILEGEQIVFLRTVANLPDVFTEAEWKEIKAKHYIHELGYMSNLSPNYYDTISLGLLKKRETADESEAHFYALMAKYQTRENPPSDDEKD